LPPARRLFEDALEQGRLKTAAGYLLVLRRAADVEDWELCKELARFLVALDKSGVTLQKALKAVGLAGDEQDANGAVN
jgi:hypothetical protein